MPGEFRSEAFIRTLSCALQQFHNVFGVRIRDLNSRGAIQFIADDVAQHIVEDGVTGGVGKLRDVQRHAAIRGQRRAGVVFVNTDADCGQDHKRSRQDHPVADARTTMQRGLCAAQVARCCYSSRLRVPLQSLQIRTYVGGVLVAQIAVLLQRFEDQCFQSLVEPVH